MKTLIILACLGYAGLCFAGGAGTRTVATDSGQLIRCQSIELAQNGILCYDEGKVKLLHGTLIS